MTRRDLVALLSVRGMSTRAIAPVAGVSQRQVSEDVRSHFSPEPEPAERIDYSTGEVLSTDRPGGTAPASCDAQREPVRPDQPPAPRPVTGLDGKTYKRPEVKPR